MKNIFFLPKLLRLKDDENVVHICNVSDADFDTKCKLAKERKLDKRFMCNDPIEIYDKYCTKAYGSTFFVDCTPCTIKNNK